MDPATLAGGGGAAAAAALSAGGDGGQPMAADNTKPAPAPITIPLSFLAQPDNSEQMQTPAKGDSGTMNVDYTVVDIQGDMAIVQPTAVNGNDLGADEEDKEPTPDEQDAQEGSVLRDMAAQMGGGQ